MAPAPRYIMGSVSSFPSGATNLGLANSNARTSQFRNTCCCRRSKRPSVAACLSTFHRLPQCQPLPPITHPSRLRPPTVALLTHRLGQLSPTTLQCTHLPRTPSQHSQVSPIGIALRIQKMLTSFAKSTRRSKLPLRSFSTPSQSGRMKSTGNGSRVASWTPSTRFDNNADEDQVAPTSKKSLLPPLPSISIWAFILARPGVE